MELQRQCKDAPRPLEVYRGFKHDALTDVWDFALLMFELATLGMNNNILRFLLIFFINDSVFVAVRRRQAATGINCS